MTTKQHKELLVAVLAAGLITSVRSGGDNSEQLRCVNRARELAETITKPLGKVN